MGALEIIVLVDTILIVALMVVLYLLKKHVDKTSLNHNRKIQILEELMNIYISYYDDDD